MALCIHSEYMEEISWLEDVMTFAPIIVEEL